MDFISSFTKTEYALLSFLRHALSHSEEDILPSLMEREMEDMLALADRHEVLALLYPILESEELTGKQRQRLEWKVAKTVHKGIELQVLNDRITGLLEGEGIKAITLKGCTVSRFYPVPEYRKTTDIDLFVSNPQEVERVVQILSAHGFRLSKEWHANHHVVMLSEKNEEVEIHMAWADPFKEKHLNGYLEKLRKESGQHCQLIDCQGFRVYGYEMAWQAFYLLIHMLLHFVGSGFGLRNLCDWVVLWEKCEDEKARADFREMVRESGTEEFARALTLICIKYLGLDPAKSPVTLRQEDHILGNEILEEETSGKNTFGKNTSEKSTIEDDGVADALLRDILDAGEFGYSEAERMVGMDGNSMIAYVKEFHHQMHINFPRTGKIVLFWPVLWIATLLRFLNNNRKLNRPAISDIMKKAGKRGELVQKIWGH